MMLVIKISHHLRLLVSRGFLCLPDSVIRSFYDGSRQQYDAKKRRVEEVGF